MNAKQDGRRPAFLYKLRPAKVQRALRRRWFEHRVPRLELAPVPRLAHLGSSYGGWIVPDGLVDPSWVCYTVGIGGDITFDLALIERYGATVRAFDAVTGYVEEATADAGGEPRFSAHHAAIASADGPLRMQVTHDLGSRSVSSARLYESTEFVELPGRSLESLMSELGDGRIDLLKLDVEGAEYDLLEQLDLRALGVKVFATQLHHTGSVTAARELIARLSRQGFEPVAVRSAVKITFVDRALLQP